MIIKDFSCLTEPQVEENEVTLLIGDEPVQNFLCTPEALEELAVGHLYCREMITSAEQISRIDIKAGEKDGLMLYTIRVQLNEDLQTSGRQPEPVPFPSLPELQALADRIKDMAGKYHGHGGVHCACLSDGRDTVALFEDVGRHNAFDKAIGSAVMKGLDPSKLIYFSSGRINSEIAEKAAVCNLPLLVSRSIATNRACAIVRKTGSCIIGRIESKTPILYTAPAREAE